jgi:putative ABC transport system permease protein
MPFAQAPDTAMQIVVRSAGTPGAVVAGVRTAMHRLDADMPITELKPMSDLVRDSLATAALTLSLLGIFAGAAMLLAAAGVYGVMSYAVAQRRTELGIRLALGASRRDLLTLVGRQGMRFTLAGIAAGSGAAWLTSSLLRDMVYGVRPTDPLVFAGTAALLAAVALVACAVPALRAMKVDPLAALRAE